MLAKRQFTSTLIALDKLLRESARRHPEFRARLKEKNFTAAIKLRDNSQGRFFRFENGKVRSKAGVWPADVSMAFHDAELAARLLKPNKKQLDYLHAVKNFQFELQGPDELTIWLSETLNMLDGLDARHGTDMGDGVMRYTTNTNGGPVFVFVNDGKILRITPIEFDEQDAPSWTIKARGKSFTPPRKTTVNSHTLAWKSMIYSPDRLLYP